LSPALAAELERVVLETRQQIESEFDSRLQAAAQQAESERQQAIEAAVREAVERATQETSDSVRRQVTDELTAQFEAKLSDHESATKNAADGFTRSQNDWNAEREDLQNQVQQWRTFAEAQKQLVDAASQSEILARALKFAEVFGSSIAIYTARADGLALWKSRGVASFPAITSQQTNDPEFYFKPILVRGKTVAALTAQKPFRADALDFLAESMQLAIELFGLKLRAK
jgi:hypothetical protein